MQCEAQTAAGVRCEIDQNFLKVLPGTDGRAWGSRVCSVHFRAAVPNGSRIPAVANR